jgi:hypothetical protein
MAVDKLRNKSTLMRSPFMLLKTQAVKPRNCHYDHSQIVPCTACVLPAGPSSSSLLFLPSRFATLPAAMFMGLYV